MQKNYKDGREKKERVVIAKCWVRENLMGRVQWHIVKVLSMILDVECRTLHIYLCTSLGYTYNNIDSIVKSRDITLPTKVCLVKAMVFQ